MAAWTACLQTLFSPSHRTSIRRRFDCEVAATGRVAAAFELWIPQAAPDVWGSVEDLPRFLTIDPFHRKVVVTGPINRPGAAIEIVHGLFGIRFSRFGKLLSFREGSGFAFSDLSARGGRRGFPHVFTVGVEPLAGGRTPWTRLSVRIRGKWTARWMPKWAVRWWIETVCREHARLLAKAFSERTEAP